MKMVIWANAFKMKKYLTIWREQNFFFIKPFAFWTTKAMLRNTAWANPS